MQVLRKPSKIEICWVRGSDNINFREEQVYLVLGRRGAGKSALLEAIGENHFVCGNNILDLFGASSGEGLAWLRSPWVEEDNRALLIKGEDIDVMSSWNVKDWRSVTLHDLENNRFVISATPLYRNKDEEYLAAGRVLDLLFERISFSRLIYVLVRESSSLFYSRLKIRKSQLEAKAEGSYVMREARHHGMSMGLDTQKLTAVDADLRMLCDFIFIKSLGILGLPHEWKWVFGYFDPAWVRSMYKREFGCITAKGAVGAGENEMPSWHKRPQENIFRSLDIRISKPPLEEQEREAVDHMDDY